MRSRLTHDVRLCLAVFLALAILVGGGLAAVRYIAGSLLRAEAQATAESWARRLAATIDELPLLLAKVPPGPATRAALEEARSSGSVYRFKLFDAQGQLVLTSEDLGKAETKATLQAHRPHPSAASSLLSGRPLVEAKRGTPPQSPDYFAESYVPLRSGQRVIGVAEVYVDQTERAERIFAAFHDVAIALSALLVTAIGLPLVIFGAKGRERRAVEARVRYLAHHDVLTGLANREQFRLGLDQALARARRDGSSVGVLCLDLDRFKEVNDTLGHAAGDALLRHVADRLRAEAREGDIVARLSGDEFAILQQGGPQPESSARLAERLCRVLCQPITFEGNEIVCSASIGIALSPADAEDGTALLKAADLALYRAKADGRNGYCLFRAEMGAHLVERRTLERDLRSAFAVEAFELAYQPQVELATGRIRGYEALLRWRHPERGCIPADRFLEVAESTGLIIPLGSWVLRRACRDAQAWPEGIKIAVNLAPAQFRIGDLVGTVAEILRSTDMAPERLELEITEGLIQRDTEAVLTKLSALRDLGVRLALDDFGTGHSSLALLCRFPFDKLKIHQAFVADLHRNPNVAAILGAIVRLGRTLGITVIAEGVESEIQARALKQAGCDEAQGYYFGVPATIEDLVPPSGGWRRNAKDTSLPEFDMAASG